MYFLLRKVIPTEGNDPAYQVMGRPFGSMGQAENEAQRAAAHQEIIIVKALKAYKREVTIHEVNEPSIRSVEG